MAHITTVDVTAGVPTAGTGTVYTLDGIINTEDNASASGDIGIVTLAKRSSTGAANTSGTDGDYEPLQVKDGKLYTQAPWAAGNGVGFTWTDATTTASLNSLTSTQCLLGTVAITNQTALDRYMDVDIVLASAAFTGTGINISIHLYPLSSDAATYGDGKFGSAAAGPCSYPPVAVIPLVAATQAQTGQATGIVIPPGTFKLVICNNGGVNLAASGNTVKYRTYS